MLPSKLMHGTALLAATLLIADYAFLRLKESRHETFVYVPDRNTRCAKSTQGRATVDVVMFVPSPIQWESRRRPVLQQFLRENWSSSQAQLIFVFGTKTGERLEKDLDTSVVQQHPGAKYLFTECRDFGDERNNPNGTSSTTCKVYEACVYIAQRYDAKYVWRGSDDSYINLKLFFRLIPTLPKERLYMGYLREAQEPMRDLLLETQPKLAELFNLHQFGGYMGGAGYVLSGDVVDFIGTLQIPPHLTWCEDVMVGMWLNPFRITKLQIPDIPNFASLPPLLVHYMHTEWWFAIPEDGAFWPPFTEEKPLPL
jgi:hypothetical protein